MSKQVTYKKREMQAVTDLDLAALATQRYFKTTAANVVQAAEGMHMRSYVNRELSQKANVIVNHRFLKQHSGKTVNDFGIAVDASGKETTVFCDAELHFSPDKFLEAYNIESVKAAALLYGYQVTETVDSEGDVNLEIESY